MDSVVKYVEISAMKSTSQAPSTLSVDDFNDVQDHQDYAKHEQEQVLIMAAEGRHVEETEKDMVDIEGTSQETDDEEFENVHGSPGAHEDVIVPIKHNRGEAARTAYYIHGNENTVCRICNKNMSSASNLMQHMRTHTGDKPYLCPVCLRAFGHRTALRNHHLLHTGEKPYVCDFCEKAFTQRSSLQKHELTHTGVRPFTCLVCDKAFSQKGNLNTHMLTHQPRNKSYSCDVCFKSFALKSNLKQHINNTHCEPEKKLPRTEMPVKCDACNKYFACKANLRQHIVRKYCKRADMFKCKHPGCLQTFVQKEDLKKHVLQEHVNVATDNKRVVSASIVQLKEGDKTTACTAFIRKLPSGNTETIKVEVGNQKPTVTAFVEEKAVEGLNQPNAAEIYACLACPETFVEKRQLQQHQLTHVKVLVVQKPSKP